MNKRATETQPSAEETLEYPLLSSLYSSDQLDRHGEEMARTHQPDRRMAREKLLARLTENEKTLTETHNLLEGGEAARPNLIPAGVWLLDNFFLINEQIQLAREHLPKRYSRELPRLRMGQSAGLPRVYEIVRDLISHVDGRVDESNLRTIISSYQRVTSLTLGELWAVPIMLRLALIENTARIAARIASGLRARDRAFYWASRLIATAEHDPKNIIIDIADMAREGKVMSCAFVAEMVRKLQSHNPALSLALTWIEQRLIERGQTIERQVTLDSQQQASNHLAIGNSITSLRFLTAINWKDFVEAMSRVESILREDPAGVYGKMDFGTRDSYRHVVEKTAKQGGISEVSVAAQTLELARDSARKNQTAHIGVFLIDKKLPELMKSLGMRTTLGLALRFFAQRAPLFLYTGAIALASIGATALTLCLMPSSTPIFMWIIGAFTAFGFVQAAVSLVNWIYAVVVRPRVLPRMDFTHGIPPEHCTLVTVPTMLGNQKDLSALLDKMEVCYLSNKADNLYFSLLTDFEDASGETMPEDAALLEGAKAGIRRLNDTYGVNGSRPFYLFHRSRQWNPQEKLWMGYERKRGKLETLNGFLRSLQPDNFLMEGDPGLITSVKYVVTLDTDTQLPRDCARRLVEAMAHPLNRPVYDSTIGRIVSGYGILQPRVVSSLPATHGSWYSRIFGSDSGIDPYTRAVSNVYQDVFGEGSFIGKGIYDVDAVAQVLSNRLPENRILSHDLLEGTYCRSGLISDVQLVDAFPQRYSDDCLRQYRWIRGDWQIASWILGRVPGFKQKHAKNPISPLSKWKIFDNLRRSIVPPVLLSIVTGWLFIGPWWLGIAVVAAILLLPIIPGAIHKAVQIPRRYPLNSHLTSIAAFMSLQLFQAFFAFAMLPFEAFSNTDAIMRTWYRIAISKRKLLQWTVSGKTANRRSKGPLAYFKLMGASVMFSIALGIAMALIGNFGALSLMALWMLSPLLAWLVSRPIGQRHDGLTDKQTVFLGKIARKTWRYFETFANAEDNWLPADNFQQAPREAVAHRTSPTNIGLMLLSNLGAYDMGYLCAGKLVDSIARSFGSMEKLHRYRGHFLNWYDTKTLEPLAPHYVSTVDSGNLAGYLLTLKTGLIEIKSAAIFTIQAYNGLIATLCVLDELVADDSSAGLETAACMRSLIRAIGEFSQAPYGLRTALKNLDEIQTRIGEMRAMMGEIFGPEGSWWFDAAANQCLAHKEELVFLAPWLTIEYPQGINAEITAELDANRTLEQIATIMERMQVLRAAIEKTDDGAAGESGKLREALIVLEQHAMQGASRAQHRLGQLDHLAAACTVFANQDYEFLYDGSRNLMVIGYDVAKRRQDEGFYDLLASESRLGSFIGIAQGKLPVEHWFRLGRLITMRWGKTVLLSWGGSMFEYLMPQLIMPLYSQTLLGQSCETAVDWHIDYCKKRGVPWGISESGENSTDADLNYQYRSFGVPGLGFKRDLANDLVIAPYSTALALSIRPKAACENLERMRSAGYEGRYGFYEAIDFTHGRMAGEHSPAIIRSFMSHHQGMSFIAMVNLLANSPMTRRFESDPLFRTTTLLLQERVPKASPFRLQLAQRESARTAAAIQEDLLRIFVAPTTPLPEVHLLSNGRYHVMMTNAGGGYSRWNDLAVTRWSEDFTQDNSGMFVYVRDVSSDRKWSTAFQPTCTQPKAYEAIFSLARAEFRRKDEGLDTYTEIAVSPEDDLEYRRITLSNFTGKARTIELTSFAEVVLMQPAADAAHPAFSNLFMQTEILREQSAILCCRRPRSPDEQCPWMFHLFTVRGLEQFELSFETNRLEFIGRGRSVKNPKAMDAESALSGAQGSVLDPIVSIRCRLALGAGKTVTVGFITGVAATKEQALALIDKYQDQQLGDRVFDLALIHGKVMLQQLGATEADAQLYGKLASSIVYASRFRRAHAPVLLKNTRGQSGLWAYGISGDLPIVVLRIGDPSTIDLAAKLIQAHAFWRLKGLAVDLVILNDERSGYRQVFNDQIMGLIAGGPEAMLYDKKGGLFVRNPDQMSDEDINLMMAAARVVLTDAGGTLTDQIQRQIFGETAAAKLIGPRRTEQAVPAQENFRQTGLLFFNGWGGFTGDGREYIIQIKHDTPTPMPWVNVIANKQFGTVVSQGGGYTWFENAHEFRLTPWYNDPVGDKSGEAIYLRDEISGRFWSTSPQPTPGLGDYLNRHGFGYSVFEYLQYDLKSEMWVYVDIEAPVKFWLLKVRNDSKTARKVSATGFMELVLGESRAKTQMHVRTGIDSKTGALLASNPFNTDFPGRVVFFEVNELDRSISGDRTEFIGRNGNLANPDAMHRTHLSGKVGVGLDPAAAIQVYIELKPGEEKEIVFMLGVGRDIEDARNLIRRFSGTQSAYNARDRVWGFWGRTLGAINIETPDPALNVIANGWLLYQTLSARLWARSGFYQSGGAFGFRDQLQDVMALVHAQPGLVRDQILLCASRQFHEGDVQHWWHPPSGRGVRTMISDDFLWLAFVTGDYVTKTGDTGVLDELVHFLDGRLLDPGEESYYDMPIRAHEKTSLYDHCKRAIAHALRFGKHGLPLMGSGDWNDGMNLVGVKGEGESVWLAFFLCAVLKQFEPIARIYKDEPFAELCAKEYERLQQAIESQAWDGAWYKRAFFDNGEALGSAQNRECKIDATAQSWSILSGAATADRSKTAMYSLAHALIDEKNCLIKLLDPPFDKSEQEPGYIKGYVPGVRENGGQYTHSAIWAVMAFAKMGEAERVAALLSMINPVNHGSTPEKILQYMVEPYVMAADIYAVPPHVGRGGWTWYTGSASWMYRLIMESILGLQLNVNTLSFNPCIPANWENFKIHYRYRETVYHLLFHQIKPNGALSITVDGVKRETATVELVDDRGEHTVVIVIE